MSKNRPLADRMRPNRLEDYVGQTHLLGQGMPLSVFLAQGKLPSMLLYGPPGCGKTTLARICANHVDAKFIHFSSVSCGVKEVRESILLAQQDKSMGRETILFLDEIHRFNKGQQDVLLPYVEDGTIVLIGATTEHPSFHINHALLSRLRIFHLQPLDREIIAKKLDQVSKTLQIDCSDEHNKLIETIAEHAFGDLRKALSWLEECIFMFAQGITVEDALLSVIGDRAKYRDDGVDLYDLLSAFHKSLRGSSPDGAMYWFARMIDCGVDPLVIARRMLCVASEDIGNADPQSLNMAMNAYMAYERLGQPEGYLALSQAITYLAVAPKSNASYEAMNAAFDVVRDHPPYAVPNHLCNAPTLLHLDQGKSINYRYAHHESQGYAAGQQYLPDEVADHIFYQPKYRGFEKKIADKLEKLRILDREYI